MNKKLNLSLALSVFVTAAGAFAQTTSYSDVVGYETRAFVAGTTAHAVGLVQAAVYQGTAATVTSAGITVSGSAFTANALAPSGGIPSHYIQITSGGSEGLVVDILGNTQNSLSVATGDLAGVSGTPSFVVRPHVKASTVFQGNSNLADYTDTLTIYNSDGSTTNLLRDSSASTGWIDSASFSAVDVVIYPGQGYLLNASAPGNIMTTGVVNPSKTIVPIFSGIVNLVSLANPSNGKDIQNTGLGASMADFTDTVGTFSSDGNLSQVSNLLWGGASDGFIDPASFTQATGVIVGGTEPVIVNASSDIGWVVNSPLNP
jgi:hypothetical protein